MMPVSAVAETFYRGHPWCERPIVSGAAKGGEFYEYNMTPPHRVKSFRFLSVNRLQFLLNNTNIQGYTTEPEDAGVYRPDSPGKQPHAPLIAIMAYHRRGFKYSQRSPLISATTNRKVAEGYAEEHQNYTHPQFPGWVLEIEVPSEYVCDRDEWRVQVARSGPVSTPNHPIFQQCHVFQFPSTGETDQWVFVHQIPDKYVKRAYAYPYPQKVLSCSDSEDDISKGTTPPPDDQQKGLKKRSGKLWGKKADSRRASSFSPQGKKLKLGGVEIDLTTLYNSVFEYLKKQLQSALEAKVEEVKGEFQQAAQGHAQELYQDFLFWLNEKVHAEINSKYPIDSQAFEEEFLAWLNSPKAQVRTYIEEYLRERSSAIAWLIEAYKDQASWEIAGGLKEIWGDAKNKFDRFTRAYDEAVKTPDTPYTDTLRKYGFSGSWIERFKSYEGRFNIFNDRYKIVQATEIVTGAFQSKVPEEKINSLFQLLKLMGGVAEESRIPIVSFFGQVVKAYGEVANGMLAKINALAEQIRKRQEYCLGVGTAAPDERNKVYVRTFGDSTLICPTMLSPDIYERVLPSDGRIYFWVKDKFIEGQEGGGGLQGVRETIALIQEADSLGYPNPERYRDKEKDIGTIARVYNTRYQHEKYGGGIPGLRKEAEAAINEIAERLKALEDGVDTLSCKLENLHDYLQREIGFRTTLSLPSRGPEEFSFGEVTGELKVYYAVSYVENRGGAYSTYSDIWRKIKPLSLVRLLGYVRQKDKTNQPCPRCGGAKINFSLENAKELKGCEVQKADSGGDFIAHFMTTSPDFVVRVLAEVKDKKSEERKIDKNVLGVDAVPFVRSFSITLPVPLDEPEVDTVVKKLKDLRERILALGSIRDKLYKNKALVEKASGEAKSIADSAGGRLDALRNLSQQLGEISTLCNDAATIKGKIESAAVEAEGREKQIRTQLDRASELAASCKNKDEAQMLRNAYRNSLQALRDVGRGKSAAQLANEELKQKLKAIEDKKKSTEKAKQLADEISSDVIKVKTQVEQARQSGEAGDNLRGKLVKGIESLWAEIEALERGLTEEELTEEIKKQFQELRSLLASMNPGDFNFPALVAKADEQANRIADIDKQAQTTLSKYGDARCDVTSADNEVELIGNIVTGLAVEVTVASDLPQKAAACLAKLEGGEEPTPTPTDKEPKGKVPQSVADAQDVPEPIPTSTDTEPKGKVPSSIAQAQDVPEPTPTDEGEPKGNVPPSIAQAEPTTDPTSTSTDKEPKGKIPQSIAQAGDVPEPTPTLISSPPPAPEPPLTSEPTAEPTPTSIPILTPPNKPTEGEGKRVPNEIPGGGIPGDSEYIGEFTGTVVITDMTLDGEPTDLVSKDPTPINVRISQSQGNWLVVLDASVSNETIFSDCRITTDGGSLHCEQTIQGFHTILTLNVGGNELSGEATSQGTSEGVEIRSQALYKATRTK